ncbi:gamma-secretase subunit APH-1B isoform X4 [Tamandua tetradactyla]|uniref:gamma-secretase subunit APH-1B isoform X4 n=1 Tax=Tamandua tetradactyla TaxID=48850 RepID=UPI0040548E06
MTAAVFFGCAFIAFGPALALYIFTIATHSLRIIFLIAGAFFWLVSLLLSSLIWFVAGTIIGNKDEPLKKYLLIFGVLVSVIIQEAFRFSYYHLLKKANEGLKTISPFETALSMRLLAYAFMTLVVILLHVFWGVIFFDGCEKKHRCTLLIVLLTHLLVSALESPRCNNSEGASRKRRLVVHTCQFSTVASVATAYLKRGCHPYSEYGSAGGTIITAV